MYALHDAHENRVSFCTVVTSTPPGNLTGHHKIKNVSFGMVVCERDIVVKQCCNKIGFLIINPGMDFFGIIMKIIGINNVLNIYLKELIGHFPFFQLKGVLDYFL